MAGVNSVDMLETVAKVCAVRFVVRMVELSSKQLDM